MSRANVVFVTGGASGIGRAVAERLTHEGSSVVVADSDVENGHETCESIASAGGSVIFQEIDVRDRSSIRSAADNASSQLGGITGLVNCAGVVTMTSLADLTEEEWDLVIDVNLKGTWLVTQEVARDIATAGGGSVVNISTVEAEVVVSSAGYCQVHYNASKGGVKMLTKALAVELAKFSIRVNAVAPGPIATDFVSLEGITAPETLEALKDRLLIPRIGQPEDVASAVSFLLSDESSWITGVHLPVDGGWLTR
ncbi:MAG: SDR family NAD(P)-dependent oxidoreductase [Actinomycetota bacterium]|nr:SDR family oxidoreductase [Acidimicrobiales bacterium]MEC8983025.1 SDR family NAD(P)-dependent oxidoreductase [Actinomycetota bacterium]MEC9426708.1 SDR family NAD(P)-dependent oxidoreductase [Actinomycetota bacterium]MED5165763.1 SDR family NAD(P)-dependent oxidoreductase [Actinomycetota bacterium]